MSIMLSLFLAPVAILLVIIQGIVLKVVESGSIRKGVGWTTLILAVLVGCCELLLIASDFIEWKKWPFPTVAALVLTICSLALTAAAVYLGVRLRS
jgi:hypothetical protein